MTAPAIQWYLAREGQQYGPLSEAELAKFIELGHLQPNDLLWREGFPDWRPAMVLFPQRSAQRAAAGPAARRPPPDFGTDPGPMRQASAPQRNDPRVRPVRSVERQSREPRQGADWGRLRRLAVASIIVAALAAGLWIAYPLRRQFVEFVSTVMAGGGADRKSLEAAPFSGFKGDAKSIDTAMQATALWRVIKREFPDWYADRLKEVVGLVANGKDDAAIGLHLARALVVLRRQQVDNALSAEIPRLKLVAKSFLDNIIELRKTSTDACYAFISQGEANPMIIGLLQGSEHTAHLQAQMVAILEAIADGRKSPRVYPAPRQSDYDALASDLKLRGWTNADLQLFSDEKALAGAKPEKVCQLVQDWFSAQLAIADGEVQRRLLVDSLRPVVAG
jgi:GYF domain 2